MNVKSGEAITHRQRESKENDIAQCARIIPFLGELGDMLISGEKTNENVLSRLLRHLPISDRIMTFAMVSKEGARQEDRYQKIMFGLIEMSNENWMGLPVQNFQQYFGRIENHEQTS